MKSKSFLLSCLVLFCLVVLGQFAFAQDITAPTVLEKIPDDLATGVATNTSIHVTFSEQMDLATINTTTFLLDQGATNLTGTVTFDVP